MEQLQHFTRDTIRSFKEGGVSFHQVTSVEGFPPLYQHQGSQSSPHLPQAALGQAAAPRQTRQTRLSATQRKRRSFW